MLNIGADLQLLALSRFQFAMTTIFHFFFVPMSIGLGLMVAIMETSYVVTKKPIYLQMTKFWGKIFLLSFAVGVVTGIIQEFQFGMNWAEYSRFMGDIFGAPLAIEALLAFFLESVFLGVWMFTWDRFKPAIHVIFIWLVEFGSSISALWILAANAFMQHPVGYSIDPKTGRVLMKSFSAIITNPQLWLEFPHVLLGAFTTGAFIIAGMAAWKLFKKQDVKFFTKSMRLGLIVGLVACLGTIQMGDLQTGYLIKEQPMKFAAMEGLEHNIKGPSPWALFQTTNPKTHEISNKIEVPYLLSILGAHNLTGGFEGQEEANQHLHTEFDKQDAASTNFFLPPNTLFVAFRVMAMGAGALVGVAILGLFFSRKKHDIILKLPWLTLLIAVCTFAPFVINTAGWLVTEVGRDPWVVYGLELIANGVSPNTNVGELLTSNLAFFLLFGVLGAMMVMFSWKDLKKGPYLDSSNSIADTNDKGTTEDPFSKEAFGQ